MKIAVGIAVPRKGDALSEMRTILKMQEADIYIFPEGFLEESQLEMAKEISRMAGVFVISGLVERTAHSSRQKAVILDCGKLQGEYQKNILTRGEKEKGRIPGESICCIESRFGKIGIPICYEIHFPEVCRIMSLENPCCLVNIIGTGMHNEDQFSQWVTLARARAVENELFVFGCSHFNDRIPVAFAIGPDGRFLGIGKNMYGCLKVEMDLEESGQKKYDYLLDRLPERFGRLSQTDSGAVPAASAESADKIQKIP